MLSDVEDIAYLKIVKPKTRFRGGGRTQHLSVHDAEAVRLLDSIFRDTRGSERLFDSSASAFWRRWDLILAAL